MGNQSNKFDVNKLSAEDKRRFEEGKPLAPIAGVSMRKNPKTGMIQNFPQEWIDGYDQPFKIDMTKTVKTKHLSKEIRPQEDLPQSILDLINSQPIYISKPTNFQHRVHLQVDLNSPLGIKGLTPDMANLFSKNGMDQQMVRQNPELMIKIVKGFETKNEIPDNSLLSTADFNKQIAKIEFISSNPNDLYRFAKQLGKGAMCTVYQAFNRKNERQCVAVRVMKITEQQLLHKIKIEAAVMSMCHNANIVNYHSSYYYMNCLFMLIEFMDGGCLTDVVYFYKRNIPQRISAYIMREILKGLDVLHQHKQIHRDLKSDNILINSQGIVKVADFGFAIQLTKEQQNRKSVVGTPAWMAPELIKKEKYNQLVDVWSVGVIAVELAQQQPPYLRFPALKAMYFINTKQAHRLKKGQFSNQYCDFVEKSLDKNIKTRWSVQQLLKHKFITQIGSGDKEKEQFAQMVVKMKNQK